MKRLLLLVGAAAVLFLPASSAAPGEAGLIAHWKMDEVVAGVVPDASGRGHDATLGGAAGVNLEAVPGIIGKALKFRADQEAFLSVARPEDFDLVKGMTVMAWIKPAARGQTYEILCNKGDKSGNPPWPGWRFRFFWTRIMLQYGAADGKEPKVVSPEWSAPAGFWCHVAASFDGRMLCVYVNGVKAGEAPEEGPPLLRKSPLIIGNYVGRKNAYAFDGLMDDVMVFDRALTEDEVFAAAVAGME